jgi:hypothetical protein
MESEAIALLREIRDCQRMMLVSLETLPDRITEATLRMGRAAREPTREEIDRLVDLAAQMLGDEAFTAGELLRHIPESPDLAEAVHAVAGAQRPGQPLALGRALTRAADEAGKPGGRGVLRLPSKKGRAQYRVVDFPKSTQKPFSDQSTAMNKPAAVKESKYGKT